MSKISYVEESKSTNRKETIEKQQQYGGIRIVRAIQNIEKEEARIVEGKPTVVEEGLLLPFTYVEQIQDKKLIDTIYYLLIDKDTLKQIANLVKEDEDDGK